jgi:hypothetical protein
MFLDTGIKVAFSSVAQNSQMKYNVLSVSQLRKKGIESVFTADKVILRNTTTKAIITVGKVINGVYMVEARPYKLLEHTQPRITDQVHAHMELIPDGIIPTPALSMATETSGVFSADTPCEQLPMSRPHEENAATAGNDVDNNDPIESGIDESASEKTKRLDTQGKRTKWTQDAEMTLRSILRMSVTQADVCFRLRDLMPSTSAISSAAPGTATRHWATYSNFNDEEKTTKPLPRTNFRFWTEKQIATY